LLGFPGEGRFAWKSGNQGRPVGRPQAQTRWQGKHARPRHPDPPAFRNTRAITAGPASVFPGGGWRGYRRSPFCSPNPALAALPLPHEATTLLQQVHRLETRGPPPARGSVGKIGSSSSLPHSPHRRGQRPQEALHTAFRSCQATLHRRGDPAHATTGSQVGKPPDRPGLMASQAVAAAVGSRSPPEETHTAAWG